MLVLAYLSDTNMDPVSRTRIPVIMSESSAMTAVATW